MRTLSIVALVLMVVGALNWLLIALFSFDLVAAIFGGTAASPAAFTRIIYALVGLAGLYGIAMLARLASDREDVCVPGHTSRYAGQVR